MIDGHGDDIHNYSNVRINFSSNIYAGFTHQGLFDHLKESLALITNYPEPTPISLEKHIADVYGVDVNNVMVTNGATDAIYMIAKTFKQYKPIIPQPTFSEYSDACRINEIAQNETKNIWWLCVPNNPTGYVMPKQELLDLVLQNQDDIFVVDASYAAYTSQEVINMNESLKYDNIIMLHSMTKDYGVPGLRLGYVVANDNLLDKIRSNRMPWSVNALAIESGHYLLLHRDEYKIPIEQLLSERRVVEQRLHAMNITTHDSDSHMLLCRLPYGSSADLKEYLVSKHGILIRDASNFDTLTMQHFRIAMQTEIQNNELLKAIERWI